MSSHGNSQRSEERSYGHFWHLLNNGLPKKSQPPRQSLPTRKKKSDYEKLEQDLLRI